MSVSMRKGLCDACAEPIHNYNGNNLVNPKLSETYRKNHRIIIDGCLYKFCSEKCKKRIEKIHNGEWE